MSDMTAPLLGVAVPELLSRVQHALLLSQRELGELMGVSSRTVIRYMQRGGILLPPTYEKLARAVHARDAELAALLAARAGKSLAALGLGLPPALPAPARPAPTHAHLVDSVLCAAAEATETTPREMRPGLTAALERLVAVGMTAEEALEALRQATAQE